MADHDLDTLPSEVSALRVHGEITVEDTFPLTCPDCRDTDGILLLARHGVAVAACRCGAVLEHPEITEQLVLNHIEQPYKFTVPIGPDVTWPDESGDTFNEHPHAPAIASDIAAAYANARRVEQL